MRKSRPQALLSLALSLVFGVGAQLSIAEPRAEASAGPAYGLDAPILKVDRFSDSAGTLLRRTLDPHLPGPNEPIDLDAAPFPLSVEAPDGRLRTCYDLDLRPATPARFYVFYDAMGNYQLGQFPVVDVAPGDSGYSDIWDVWKVIVPPAFREDNAIRDRVTVEKLLSDPASGYTARRTGVLLNGPIVPDASRASLKADGRGGSAALRYAWYRGLRAPYLYFEGSLEADGENAPIALMNLLRKTGRPELTAKDLRPGGNAVAPARVGAVPGSPGYSPLWKVAAPQGPTITEVPLNCPIVGP
jgi:hypothetical protein